MNTKEILKRFEQIYNETYSAIFRYVTSKCNNLDDVDDIIQETYCELYKTLKRRKYILNYEAYLRTIAKNRIITLSNKNKRIETISIFSKEDDKMINSLGDDINIEREIITKDMIDIIWKELKINDTIAAKIFYFHFIEEMTFKDIATMLEVKETTAKSILYRRLNKIKETCLGGGCNAIQ